MEADDVGQTLLLHKMPCFPVGKRCSRKIALLIFELSP